MAVGLVGCMLLGSMAFDYEDTVETYSVAWLVEVDSAICFAEHCSKLSQGSVLPAADPEFD